MLGQSIGLELLHYCVRDVANLEGAIRFGQSVMQANHNRLKGTGEPMNARVPKIENYYGMVRPESLSNG
jgi:hypothetical protein